MLHRVSRKIQVYNGNGKYNSTLLFWNLALVLGGFTVNNHRQTSTSSKLSGNWDGKSLSFSGKTSIAIQLAAFSAGVVWQTYELSIIMSLFQPGADGPFMVRLSLSFPDSMIRLYCHNLKIKHIVSNYTSIIVHCTHIKQASSSLIKSVVSNLDNTYKKDVLDVLAIIRYLFGNKNI